MVHACFSQYNSESGAMPVLFAPCSVDDEVETVLKPVENETVQVQVGVVLEQS